MSFKDDYTTTSVPEVGHELCPYLEIEGETAEAVGGWGVGEGETT